MTSTATPEQRTHMRDSFENFVYRTSQATLLVAPVIVLLPPRKLDLYTFLLSGAFVASAGHLYQQRQLSHPEKSSFLLSTKSQQVQAQIARQKERSREARLLKEPGLASTDPERRNGGSLLEGKAKEIWMGGETEGWKERRLKEERERLAKGEGYGDMIMDQIWEVWNWGERKAEDLKETDEETLKIQQKEREFPKIGKD